MGTDQAAELDRLRGQVRHLAGRLGIGRGEYELLRIGTNTVLLSRSDSVVARVASDDVYAANNMDRHFEVLAELVAGGAPLVGPIGNPAQLSDGRCVTFWPQVDVSELASAEVLTQLVAACHRLEPIPGMNYWTPEFSNTLVAKRLSRARRAGAPNDTIAKLSAAWSSALQALAGYWESLDPTKRCTALHGDPQPGNSGRSEGQWRLIDCDSVCAGPPEYDLSQIISSCRLTDPDRVQSALSAYPQAVDRNLLKHMIRSRTIQRCAWVAGLWGERADLRPKLHQRLGELDEIDAILAGV